MNYPTLLIASALLGHSSGIFTVPNFPGLYVTTNYTPIPNVEYFWGPVHKSHVPVTNTWSQSGPYYGGVFITTNWPSVIQPQPPLSTNWIGAGHPSYDFGLVSDGRVVWRPSLWVNRGVATNTISQSAFTLSATNVVFGPMEEGILYLVKSGEVCRVIGHKWQPHFRAIAFSDESRSRKCNVCEKVETQEPGEWK